MLRRLNDSDGVDAVTRADRCPISAPPRPTASAIDCAASAEGWAAGGSDGAGVTEDGIDRGAAGEGEAATEAAFVGGGVVGEGAGSAAVATPARPGPATKVAARSAIPKDMNEGRRD